MMVVAIILCVLVAVIGTPILAVLCYLAWQLYRLMPIFRKLSEVDLAAVVLLPEVVEKYQEGVIKIGEAQVEATTKLEESVTRFADMMFGNKDNRGFQEYDERAAGRVFEEDQLVKEGIPRAEARARVSEKDLYSNMSLQR